MIIVSNGSLATGIFGFTLLLLLIIRVCDAYASPYTLLLVLF
ncbi:putative membrane protein [Alteromonas macleodii]|nr:putative membrane protein [Alteromonas macleodii]